MYLCAKFLPPLAHPVRIAIFASGGGSNAKNLLHALQYEAWAQVGLLATNNPACGMFGFAPDFGLSVHLMTPAEVKTGEGMAGLLAHYQIDFVILAGYLKLIPEAVVKAFPRRILNIHPSLLPKFGGKGMFGMHVHEAVIRAGEPESGITIHYIDEAYDRGEAVFQARIPVASGWSPSDLQQAVLHLEHTHFPEVVVREGKALFQFLNKQKEHMNSMLPVRSALVSVYHKEGLDQLAAAFLKHKVKVISTGGTATYLREFGLEVHEVADMTGYPSILGGRVKTLHPKVHGGILARRDEASDLSEMEQYGIEPIDLVVVDLYPFSQTVKETTDEEVIIEKIDIGGIALIRGAAKNFRHVACIPSQQWFTTVATWLHTQDGQLSLDQRKTLSGASFDVSSQYDGDIYRYFQPEGDKLKISAGPGRSLRYGENPHQRAWFYGDLDQQFVQLHGKELSFNNLVDIDGALALIDEFDETVFAVIKHTNPCGCATGDTVKDAWERALKADPTSAFGGILATNQPVDAEAAESIDQIFFEVLVAPGFSPEALSILMRKKNRILLERKGRTPAQVVVKTSLGGFLVQDGDHATTSPEKAVVKTSRQPEPAVWKDIVFGEKVCKHLKSNAIALVRDGQLIGAGMGQTSRIDSLRQAFEKARAHGFEPKGSVLISDAFFPFADSVSYAFGQGIEVVVQPGGSVRDEETIDFCETNNMCLIFTGLRHFLH